MITENRSPAAQVNKFRNLARDVVKHHFGTKPGRIVFKAAGLTNFVFAVKHAEGSFVIRISPEPASINSFIKEHWAQRAARKAGVPTAEILEVGSEVIPFPYMITRRVEGTDGTGHENRNKIVSEMGRIAAKINGVKTKGFGATFDWSNNSLSRNDTWQEYLRGEYGWENKLASLQKNKIVDEALAKELRKIMTAAEKMKPKATLNHGDIRLKNVIADENGKITAIIDWENCTSNSAPHWELSLALHDMGIDEKQHFLEGYGISAKALADAAPLIKAFNMLNYAPAIDRLALEKNKKELDRFRIRMSGVLDLYSL